MDDSTEAQSIRWSADSYRLDAIGQPVFTFYQRISRKPAASLTTEWGDDRVVAVPSDPVR